jgi:hypothetical protein
MIGIHIVFFVLSFFVYSTSVYADIAYTATPSVMDIEGEARDILSKEITITNTGTQPVTIYPTVNNISIEDGGAIQEFLPPVESDRTQSLASWIEISRRGIDLKVGESKIIPLTIRIHPSPKFGVYHAFIGFGHGRNRDEAEKLVMSGRSTGVVINVILEDKKTEFLKLSGFIVRRFITGDTNNIATYTFRNPGNETLIPAGEIIFYDKTGKEVATASVNAENIHIAPGDEYVFETEVPYQNLFGRYKAFLNVTYGSTQRASIQDTSFFYVLPLHNISIAFAILILFTIIGGWYIHKKYFDGGILDESDRLTFHIRNGEREALHHDIDLKKKEL